MSIYSDVIDKFIKYISMKDEALEGVSTPFEEYRSSDFDVSKEALIEVLGIIKRYGGDIDTIAGYHDLLEMYNLSFKDVERFIENNREFIRDNLMNVDRGSGDECVTFGDLYKDLAYSFFKLYEAAKRKNLTIEILKDIQDSRAKDSIKNAIKSSKHLIKYVDSPEEIAQYIEYILYITILLLARMKDKNDICNGLRVLVRELEQQARMLSFLFSLMITIEQYFMRPSSP